MGKLTEIVPELVKEGLEIAEGSMIFGVRIEELEHDELVAMMAVGWNKYSKALDLKKADYK
jgi:hypothetical protein